MKSVSLRFNLPAPWKDGHFETSTVGYVNYLVGPNGSGKSRFAEALRASLPDSRILGTDRLQGLEKNAGLGLWGGGIGQGIDKNWFTHLTTYAPEQGFGLDTFILLENELSLRIQVEATLSHLFNRRIILEWDSGRLVPMAALGPGGQRYKIAGDECHGIKELLVLLTHLYHEKTKYLVIDEPELNLHPQLQAYFMEEVKRVAGDPDEANGKKVIFLITHSPFILQLRSVSDLRSIVSFDLNHSPPRHLYGAQSEVLTRLEPLVPRLNVHHKQLFFTDNPIFVEGIFDAQLIAAIQEARGVSIFAAGSCIIDAGGKDEVSKYVELCQLFGKTAHFVFDLDSLFAGSLSQCIRDDGVVDGFLSRMGLGANFSQYVGALMRRLTDLHGQVRSTPNPTDLTDLVRFIQTQEVDGKLTTEGWRLVRAALIVAISANRSAMANLSSNALITEVEGRLGQIVAALRERNIHLLSAGALENYLPSYTGSPYRIADTQKGAACQAELMHLTKPRSESDLKNRYGALYDVICLLPSKPEVDTDKVLRRYAAGYIFSIQEIATSNPSYDLSLIVAALKQSNPGMERLIELTKFARQSSAEFSAEMLVVGKYGKVNRVIKITNRTNAAVGDFELEAELGTRNSYTQTA